MKLSEIKEAYDRTVLLEEEVEINLGLLSERVKHIRKYNRTTRRQEEIYTAERLKLLREIDGLKEQARALDNLRNYSILKAVEAISKGTSNE